MTEPIASGIAIGAGAAACGFALTRKLLRYRNDVTLSSDLAPVSLSRYAVLGRLNSKEDERFLRNLPGFKPELASRLRRERRTILRMYLQELAGDFGRLHRAARRLVADAPQQHAHLVGVLFAQQFTFWRRIAWIELRLTLTPPAWMGVDLVPLIELVEGLRAEVARAAPGIA